MTAPLTGADLNASLDRLDDSVTRLRNQRTALIGLLQQTRMYAGHWPSCTRGRDLCDCGYANLDDDAALLLAEIEKP